jgi:hypothetical protein
MPHINALIKLVAIAIALAAAGVAARGHGAQQKTAVMAVGLGFAAVVGLTLFRGRSSRCSMCNEPLRRAAHKWEIDGRTRCLCPHCNRRMEWQQRAKAFDDFQSRRRR